MTTESKIRSIEIACKTTSSIAGVRFIHVFDRPSNIILLVSTCICEVPIFSRYSKESHIIMNESLVKIMYSIGN